MPSLAQVSKKWVPLTRACRNTPWKGSIAFSTICSQLQG